MRGNPMKFALLALIIIFLFGPLAVADDRVVYNEVPLNYNWAIYEGHEGGQSLNVDTAFGGPTQNGDYCAKVVYDRNIESEASLYITATGDNKRGPNIGLNLAGAKQLVFYARGEDGNEKVTFGYGFEPNNIGFADSSYPRKMEVLLKNYWQRYEYNIEDKNLSHINALFMFNVEKQYNPQGATFYIDNITYVYPSPPPPQDGINISITSIDNITNPQNGIKVAQSVTVAGKYSLNDSVDAIWVFVMPLIAGTYYPQYSCDGTGVTKENGKWEMRIGVGTTNDVGNFFDIVLGLADDEANQTLSNTMRNWCEDNNFPGLDKLPEGVVEKKRIRVIRNAESFGPAPSISNSNLPGSISITDIANEEKVPPSRLIHGSFSPDMTSDIWVLEYSSNGRWYPQSINPCNGIFTAKVADQWQGSMSFGGSSGKFDIVVVAATPEASKILSDYQKWCCKNKSYPGLLTIQLPKGLTEKSRVRVYLQ
jgi:hypothetical protein